MRYREIIDEYTKVPEQKFRKPNFSTGNHVGQISTTVGLLDVWKLADGGALHYGAIDPTHGLISFVSFLVGTNLIMAKNTQTETGYRNKGIVSELLYFINRQQGHKILSDIEMSDSGEALWNKLIHTPRFDVKILYLPTSEVFSIKDIGQIKTSDGLVLKSPKDDADYDKVYDPKTDKGQRFFYLIESKNNHGNILETAYGFSGGNLEPHRYFDDGDI